MALAAVLLLAAATGCSNGESPRAHPDGASGAPVVDSTGPDGVQTVTIETDDGLRFRPSVVQARPGKVAIRLHDGGDTPHNLQFGDRPGIANVAGGQTREATFTLTSPGTYRFVCTYHERLGMTGALVIG